MVLCGFLGSEVVRLVWFGSSEGTQPEGKVMARAGTVPQTTRGTVPDAGVVTGNWFSWLRN